MLQTHSSEIDMCVYIYIFLSEFCSWGIRHGTQATKGLKKHPSWNPTAVEHGRNINAATSARGKGPTGKHIQQNSQLTPTHLQRLCHALTPAYGSSVAWGTLDTRLIAKEGPFNLILVLGFELQRMRTRGHHIFYLTFEHRHLSKLECSWLKIF